MTPSRPVLRWHGSKWRIAPWVIAHFPPHRVYVEPFGGSASVLLQKPRAPTEVFNDLDRDIVNMFRVIRECPRELAAALALTPFARDEYQAAYNDDCSDVERARRLIARSFMGMNSKGALRKSGFDARTNPDGFTGRLRSLVDAPDQVLAVAERFCHVVVENCDALGLVGRYDRADALIYLDPPYLPETRSGKFYAHEMTVEQHRDLITRIRSLSAMVILSGYHSPLYDRLLQGWECVDIPSRTDGGAAKTEALWINPAASRSLDRARSQTQITMFAREVSL